jgi:hypothetical protein
METCRKSVIAANNSIAAEVIQEMLQQMEENEEITRVELHGLVMSDHADLLPTVKALASCRAFESFGYVDMIRIDDYPDWQELRDEMMQDYEQSSYALQSQFIDSVSWRADIQIPKGTPAESLLGLLEDIQDDLDVFSVSFSGSLDDCHLPFLAQELCSLIDSLSWRLKEEISICVTCGWGDEDDWLQLLEDCSARLSELISKRPGSHNKCKDPLEGCTESTRSCSVPDKSFPDCLSFNESYVGGLDSCTDEEGDEEKSLASLFQWSSKSLIGYSSFYEASYASFGNNSTNTGISLGADDTRGPTDASQVMPKAA